MIEYLTNVSIGATVSLMRHHYKQKNDMNIL